MKQPVHLAHIPTESVNLAKAILDDSIRIIEGSRKLARLGYSWTAHEEAREWCGTHDTDFDFFKKVDSETMQFPIEEQRCHWSAAALKRVDGEVTTYETTHRDEALAACRRILEKFQT